MSNDPATPYCEAVTSGEATVGRLLRLSVERHLRDLDDGHKRALRYDAEDARAAVLWFSRLHHYKGRWARPKKLKGYWTGKKYHKGTDKPIRCSCPKRWEECPTRFRPENWQRFVIAQLYGWKRQNELGEWVRRFSTAYLQLARKNGKSFFAAAVGNKGLVGDDEPSAEVYAAATKKDQARYVHDIAKGQVRFTQNLRTRIEGWDHRLGNLWVAKTSSKFEPVAAEANTLDSLSPSIAIVDELHAHPTPDVRNVLWSGMGARDQPLLFEITTAGEEFEGSVCKAERDYAEEILEGRVTDDRFFAFVAEPDEGDDWKEKDAWIKANPNIGVSVLVSDIEAECKKAQANPLYRHEFKTKRCNLWDSAEVGLFRAAGSAMEDSTSARLRT
jgi:phage terminase large subunit-like protein